MNLLSGAAPIVQFAFLLGVVICATTLLMLLATIAMRLNGLRMERIDARAEAHWRPLLLAPATDAVGTLPGLARRDLRGFIHVWNEAHEPLHPATTGRLAKIADNVALEAHLIRFLHTSIFHHRVMAIIALGHIKNESSFERVLPSLDDKSPIMSLCAARSLMQIDPVRAVPKLVPLIVQRGYWSQGVVASILKESDGQLVAEPLADATLHATSDVAPRMIRFLAGVHPESAAPIIREALRTASDERIISTCLQAMSNPADLDCVRPLLSHPLWYLRMQAATTLGNLGVPGDELRLRTLLSDGQWWVRYRAAQALLKLSFISADDARLIQQSHTDAYARDIIDHVLAERTLEVGS
ncbi:MAG: HEAT repeat domain-containing protein [Pseudomonadota bacterium]